MRPSATVNARRDEYAANSTQQRDGTAHRGGNRFERHQAPAAPRLDETFGATFVREGGAPVAFALTDEPEVKPEKKGREIDAFLEELKSRQAEEPAAKGSFPSSNTQNSTTNLYVGNISPATTEAQVAKVFGRYGPVESVKIMWPRTDEERRRGRNCGFVQYSTREDALAAKDAIEGQYVDGRRLKVGWGKACALPKDPPPQLEQLGPSLSSLAAEAQARAKRVLRRATTEMGDADARVDVAVPSNVEQRDVVDRLADAVARDPGVEDLVRIQEAGNPLFSFLRRKSLVATYYRCRVWTLVMGERAPQPFQLETGQCFWVPPGCARSRSPSPEMIEEKDDDKFLTGRQAERARERSRARGKHRKLSAKEREELARSVAGLTVSRTVIADALLKCYDACSSAPGVCLILKRSLCRCALTTSLAARAARLYLISDVLRNASTSRTGATFRTTIQGWLPEAFEALASARRVTLNETARLRYERRVEATLSAWLRWSLFPPAFVHGLESAFFAEDNDGHAHSGAKPDVLALKRRARQAGVFDGDEWPQVARRVNRARRFSRARLSGASCAEAVQLAAVAASEVIVPAPVAREARYDSSDCDGEPCDAADLVLPGAAAPWPSDLLPPAAAPVVPAPPAAPLARPPPFQAPASAPAPPPAKPRAPPPPRRPRSRSRSRDRRRDRSPRRRRSRSRSRGRRDDRPYYPRR